MAQQQPVTEKCGLLSNPFASRLFYQLRNPTMRWLLLAMIKKTFGTALVATKSHTPSTHITQCDSQAQLQLCTHTHAHMRCGMYYLYLSITSTMRPKMDPLNKRRSNNHWKAEKWIRRGSRLPITIFFFEKKRSSEVVHADLLGLLWRLPLLLCIRRRKKILLLPSPLYCIQRSSSSIPPR